MAKQQLPWSKKDEGVSTPSLYGSHKSMVVFAELDVFADTFRGADNVKMFKSPVHGNVWDKEVVLEDNDGFYITSISRLDSGLADPRRYSHADRDAVFDATLKEYDLTRESFLERLAEFNEKYVWVDGEIQEKPDEEATD